MTDIFKEKLEWFLKEWNDIVKTNYAGQFGDTNLFKEVTYTKGRKYVKVIQEGSVCAFIQMNTGDIFKPASWRAPAKHVRGNLFSKTDGLEAVGVHEFIFTVNRLR